jgi:hypothetical protein
MFSSSSSPAEPHMEGGERKGRSVRRKERMEQNKKGQKDERKKCRWKKSKRQK